MGATLAFLQECEIVYIVKFVGVRNYMVIPQNQTIVSKKATESRKGRHLPKW